MIPAKRLIGELMVEAELISAEQLQGALVLQKESNKKIAETLIDLGFLKQEEFETFIARQPGIASLDLYNYEVPRELVDRMPREAAQAHQAFPIDTLGKLLTVAMVCPLDRQAITAIEDLTGLRVKAIRSSLDDIEACIRQYYPKSEYDENDDTNHEMTA